MLKRIKAKYPIKIVTEITDASQLEDLEPVVDILQIGTRNMQKSLLIALLEPFSSACAAEKSWDFTERMAVMEAAKTLPWGSVWQYFCEKMQIPQDFEVMKEIHQYEKKVLFNRN